MVTLDRTVIIRVSNNEWLRWKRNCGNISLTIRAVMDVHVHHIEESRKYQEHCYKMIEQEEKLLAAKTGVQDAKIRKYKRTSVSARKSSG